ncbi:hypothetical protein WG66_011429 [Moniliophthora roreri]|nr:hypothetical protein WG66_011429 [Moniliophthora roreri]
MFQIKKAPNKRLCDRYRYDEFTSLFLVPPRRKYVHIALTRSFNIRGFLSRPYINSDGLGLGYENAGNEIQELDVRCWSISSSPNDDGNLHTYRFPEGLRALQYSDPFFIPSDNLESTLSWLQSHPPLRQMRRLSFVKAVPSSRAVIQAFINICPNLDTFYLSCWNGDKTHETTGVIDLSHNKDLNRLCFYIPGFGNTNSDFSVREEALLNTILLTVRTATSLRGSLEFLRRCSHGQSRYSRSPIPTRLEGKIENYGRMKYASGGYQATQVPRNIIPSLPNWQFLDSLMYTPDNPIPCHTFPFSYSLPVHSPCREEQTAHNPNINTHSHFGMKTGTFDIPYSRIGLPKISTVPAAPVCPPTYKYWHPEGHPFNPGGGQSPMFLSFRYGNAGNGVENGRYNNVTATTNRPLTYQPFQHSRWLLTDVVKVTT